MPNFKIDFNLISRKIELIKLDLSRLKTFENYSFEEISKDFARHATVERLIERIVGEAIDINQHIISQSEMQKLPFNFKKSFEIMADLKIYSKEFAEKIAHSVGLRNILVHQYSDLNEEIFYASIKDCLKDYEEYCKYILTHLASI